MYSNSQYKLSTRIDEINGINETVFINSTDQNIMIPKTNLATQTVEIESIYIHLCTYYTL